MAALLGADQDDEQAEDAAPSVEHSGSGMVASGDGSVTSGDGANGVAQATEGSLAWQGTVSTQLLEEPAPGRSWSHSL